MTDDYSHDCFLSHNSRDQADATRLAAVLKGRKLLPWIDREDLAPGEPWLDGLGQALRTCRSVAVLIGPAGAGPWQAEETRTAQDLAVRGRLRIFAVLLPDSGPSPEIPDFLGNRNWVDLRSGLDDAAGHDRLEWGITGVRPGRSAAAPDRSQPRTGAPPAGAPEDPPTVTLRLRCQGDKISIDEGHPRPAPPRTASLATLRRQLSTRDQDLVFQTLFESPARLADLVTAAEGAPADEPTGRPLRLRLLCDDGRIAALPWHHLHYQGERLGAKPGWIIEVMEQGAGDTLSLALARPLVVAPADPTLAISARGHVNLVTAHLARLLDAPRTPVPWAKTVRELDEALGESPEVIYIFAPLDPDGRLVLGTDPKRREYYGLDRLAERLRGPEGSRLPWRRPLLWLHLVADETAVDLQDLWTRLRPLTLLLLIQVTPARMVEDSLGGTLDLMKQMADQTAEPAAVVSRLGAPAGLHLWLGGQSIRLRPGKAEAWVIASIRASLLRLLLGRLSAKRQVAGGINEAPEPSLTFYGVCGEGHACVHEFPDQVRRYVEVYYRGSTVETRAFPLTMRAGPRVRDEVVRQFKQDLSISQVRSVHEALETLPVVPPDPTDRVIIALSWLLEPDRDFPATGLADWLTQWKQGLLEVLGQAQIPKTFRVLVSACVQWTPDWEALPRGDADALQRQIDQALEQTDRKNRKGYRDCIKMLAPLDRLEASDLTTLYRDQTLHDGLRLDGLPLDEDRCEDDGLDPLDVLAGYLLDRTQGRFQDTCDLIYTEYQCGYQGLKEALTRTPAADFAKIAGAVTADPAPP